MKKCPDTKGGFHEFVWDGDWDTLFDGGGDVEHDKIVHFSCQQCGEQFEATYTFQKIEEKKQ